MPTARRVKSTTGQRSMFLYARVPIDHLHHRAQTEGQWHKAKVGQVQAVHSGIDHSQLVQLGSHRFKMWWPERWRPHL